MKPQGGLRRALLYAIAAIGAGAQVESPAASPATAEVSSSELHLTVGPLERLMEIGRTLCGVDVTKAMYVRALREAARALDPRAEVVRERDRDAVVRAWCRHSWGLGIRTALSNGQHVVVAVVSNGPAAARLQVGDILDQVAGRFVTGIAEDKWKSWVTAATGAVEIVVVRPPQREPIQVAVLPAWVAPEVGEVELLPRGLRMVRLAEVREGAADLVLGAWEAASTGRTAGVVLDLRATGGMDLTEAARIAAVARPGRPNLFELESRVAGVEDMVVASRASPIAATAPMVVLIGPHTADAAEALAVALTGGSVPVMCIGQPTMGSLCRYEWVPLGGDLLAWLPVRRLKIEGTVLGETVHPQIEVAARPAASRETATGAAAGLNPKRRASAEEEEDRRLRERIAGDAELERAVNLLLAVHALGLPRRPQR